MNVPPNVLDVRPPRTVVFVETPLRLDGVEAALQRAMPGGGAGGAQLGVLDARWQLQRQVPTVSAAAPGLVLRVPITGTVSVGAGFLRCQASGVGGIFTIGLRPSLDGGGALVLRDPQVSVAPVGVLSCAGVQVPLAQLFGLMLKPIEQALAAGLAQLRVPLGPAIERGLAELGKPQGMDLDGRRACMDLDPAGLVVAPMAGSGQVAALRLGVDVAPRLSLAQGQEACPGKAAQAPRELSVREESAGGQSRVQVAVAVPAADLQAPLAKALVGRRFGSGKDSVLVGSVALGDASGRALVRLSVTGAYNGDLFLWGTPQVRMEGGRYSLSVPDLQVAGESTSKIEELRLNLFQLFDGDLAARLRPILILDVTERLAQVQRRLGGALQLQPGMWLRSQVTELQPVGVESRPGLIVAYVMLVGTLQLDIR